MKQGIVNKAFSTFISITLVATFALPTTAFAAQPEVQVENHTTGMQTVSKLSIDGVETLKQANPLTIKQLFPQPKELRGIYPYFGLATTYN